MKDKAKQMYIGSNGAIPLKDIAEQLGVPVGSVRGWKSRYKWDDEIGVTLQRNATKNKRSATSKRNATNGAANSEPKKKSRYREGSRKGVGNPNPMNQFTERNSAALKHGLFSRYIPKETLEIMGMLDKSDPADLIWDQIQIQYAAIIRAQQIMFVADKDEMIKELKKSKYEVVPSDNEEGFKQVPTEEEYEFQFAWDRHATFLNAQSRAMSELRSLIKQFCDLAHDDDERRLKIEMMQLGLEKTKVELSQMRGDEENDAHDQASSYEEALNAQTDDVFAGEVDVHEEA